MVGMGKTMANWISALEDPQMSAEEGSRQAALEGLNRLQKTLIDGATITTNELKQWAWSTDLASTPSVSSIISANPLETGNATEDIEFVPLHDPTDTEQDLEAMEETPTKENTPLPPDTFALETSPTKGSFRIAPAYLKHPSQFTRKLNSPTPREPSFPSGTLMPGARLTAGVPTSIKTTTSPPDTDPRRAQSDLDRSAVDAENQKASHHNSDVDPLFGLAVANEPSKLHVYGQKRMRNDPLRGLGIL